jgi:cellobiose epimerase
MADLVLFRNELNTELHRILHYWIEHAIDHEAGGFYGSISNDNIAAISAAKGLVLNARILWAFSAAYSHQPNEQYLAMATRAWQYLLEHFTDNMHGGAFWSVDAAGNPLSDRKQVYGLAFYLYGLSEYHGAVKEPAVLQEAIGLFRLIEEKSFDPVYKGYFEAFTRDWQPLADLRLSEKDANENKTTNTHLHIIEAYACLYRQWPNELLKQRIMQLLELFDKYMIDAETGHLHLFFNEHWQLKPDMVSYGHDIEAAWLLLDCAITINDSAGIAAMRRHALRTANAAMEGLDKDGGLWYEYNMHSGEMIKEKHWWPQAEAMLGFFNAWEISGQQAYLEASLRSWNFIKNYLLHAKGEWVWGVNANYSLMNDKEKLGFWKCPYHNSRACIELIKRLNPGKA